MPHKLVIVESPTKARTITRFLDNSYKVTSSQGHVRDLPKSDLGVDVEHGFTLTYDVPDKSKKTVAELRRLAKDAEVIYFATDEDREGEAISWHLTELLKPRPEQVQRIVFHEITKEAILEALANPRKIDAKLVDAQQARRVLDRLVGYELSPFLWQKIRYGLSAGRVQSVAVRLIVEREREIQAFKPQEYWTIEAMLQHAKGSFAAQLTMLDGKKVEKFSLNNQASAHDALQRLQKSNWHIADVEQKETKRSPLPPFTTSTLQQDANRRLGFSAKRTMVVAQQLYEGISLGTGEEGLITYMRTDSLSLSGKFLQDAQTLIVKKYGAEYTTGTRGYKTNKKGAQEAHEAIRPTEAGRTPESIREYLEPDQLKLYQLIWSRAVASQMSEQRALSTRIAVNSADDQQQFRAAGSVVTFPGFTAAYPMDQKDEQLPQVTKGDAVTADNIEPKQHFTEPPARYSDATLVKALEEYGIGRPSTYAPTISTIIDRGYVLRNDARRLAPTDTGFLVNDVLVKYFASVVDFEFTAEMEKELDEIAEGQREWVPVIRDFYGPFHKNLEETSKKVAKTDILPVREVGVDPKTGITVFARTGRFGSYVQLGEYNEADRKAKKSPGGGPPPGRPRSMSLLPNMALETVTLEDALKLLELPKHIADTAAGEPIKVTIGRFGPYLSAGKINVTLPAEYNVLTLTPEQAKEIFTVKAAEKAEQAKPIAELGESPITKKQVVVKNGRFGPYITDGETNCSVGKKIDPSEVTLEIALEMLAKKKASPKKAWGRFKKGK